MVEKKMALIFPGQGTHWDSMGSDIYSSFDNVRSFYAKSFETLGLPEITGPNPFAQYDLSRTDNQQIAIFITNQVFYALLNTLLLGKPRGLPKYSLVTGHSLGEYNALVVAGALSFNDALGLIEARGKRMHECAIKQDGGLVALLGNIDQEARDLMEEKGVHPALYNFDDNIVVGGSSSALNGVIGYLQNRGIRAIKLDVEGPFHTKYMKDAADKFKDDILKTPFYKLDTPVIVNSSAVQINTQEEIDNELYAQIFNPVRWTDTIRRLVTEGVELYVVAGADKREFIRKTIQRIKSDAEVLVVKDIPSLEHAVSVLR